MKSTRTIQCKGKHQTTIVDLLHFERIIDTYTTPFSWECARKKAQPIHGENLRTEIVNKIWILLLWYAVPGPAIQLFHIFELSALFQLAQRRMLANCTLVMLCRRYWPTIRTLFWTCNFSIFSPLAYEWYTTYVLFDGLPCRAVRSYCSWIVRCLLAVMEVYGAHRKVSILSYSGAHSSKHLNR